MLDCLTCQASAVFFFVLSLIYMTEVTLRFGQLYKAGVPNGPTKASLQVKAWVLP